MTRVYCHCPHVEGVSCMSVDRDGRETCGVCGLEIAGWSGVCAWCKGYEGQFPADGCVKAADHPKFLTAYHVDGDD